MVNTYWFDDRQVKTIVKNSTMNLFAGRLNRNHVVKHSILEQIKIKGPYLPRPKTTTVHAVHCMKAYTL